MSCQYCTPRQPVPPHTKTDCTANDLFLGGESGLFCGNCGAECGSLTTGIKDKTDEEES